jgi:hypothetical protein
VDNWRPLGDSNPCFSRERVEAWMPVVISAQNCGKKINVISPLLYTAVHQRSHTHIGYVLGTTLKPRNWHGP